MRRLRISTFALALALCAAPAAARAATASPPPKASVPNRIDVTKIQPKALLPKKKLHTEFVVEVNRLGQVTRVRSGKRSTDTTYNQQTYGNALQAFIRTPDGHAISGTYKLSYDFDPKTARVHRDVALIREGGVDPDAKGAALDMMSKAHPRPSPSPAAAAPAPSPGPSVNGQRLPDLNGIMKPSPKPTAH